MWGTVVLKSYACRAMSQSHFDEALHLLLRKRSAHTSNVHWHLVLGQEVIRRGRGCFMAVLRGRGTEFRQT